MKDLVVSLVSLVLTSLVIWNAYVKKKQIYPAAVYITKSAPSMAVIYVQGLILAVVVAKLLGRLLFGRLQAAERERLIEKAKLTFMDTCLAFAAFRNDVGARFVSSFALLFFVKVFHWLVEERVDSMERRPEVSKQFHTRILTSFFLLGALDMMFVKYIHDSTFSSGLTTQTIFGFEYAILLLAILASIMRYILHNIDIQFSAPWEYKPVVLMFSNLILGAAKIIIYALFLLIMIDTSTIPLFACRNFYQTVKDIKETIRDIVQSRRAIRAMDTMFLNATPEDLSVLDNVCIICREDISIGTQAKKLPCDHIFHSSCLRCWFHRQQTCPTCRFNILRPSTGALPQFQQIRIEQERQDQERRYSNRADLRLSNRYSSQRGFIGTRPNMSAEEVRTVERLTGEQLDGMIRLLQRIGQDLDSIVLILRHYQSMDLANRKTQSTQTPDEGSYSGQVHLTEQVKLSEDIQPTCSDLKSSTSDDSSNAGTSENSHRDLIRQRRLDMLNKIHSFRSQGKD